jgi:crotonobetainyl-CoA:carnitine CoA-transferase CaiB-like acyl-CoA transferase
MGLNMTEAEGTGATPAALAGLRVLDLSRILAGPWAGQILGDLGAEVIKVENPKGGDDTRHWGPPFVPGGEGAERCAAYFTACNRNKRSIAVDFAQPEGAALIRSLARQCDVVIENFKVGGLAKYGLDYDSLSAENPGLIYCSITGFGQTGPYAHRSGYDYLIQGMAGLMSITGLPDGAPGGGPMKVGVAVSDLFTGLYAAVSILAALNHRRETGEGQHIDAALFDAQAAMLANQAANWLVGGLKPGRLGNNHPNVVPYRVYPVSDGHIIIAVGNDGQFRRLCEALEMPALAEDPRYRTCPDRVDNRAPLDAAIEAALARLTRDGAIALLESVSVPCGPINDIPDVFADPQAEARGLVVPLENDAGVAVKGVAFPTRLSRTPAQYRSAPPSLGADTETVLGKVLEMSAAEIERLRGAGVLG